MTLDDEQAILRDRLGLGARGYLDAHPSAPVSVVHLGSDLRPASRLHRFRIRAGDRVLHAIVKVGLPRGQASAISARPRLVDPAPFGEKAAMEYATMTAVADTFRTLGDPRFGWVQPLEHLADLGAVVMVEEPAHDLRRGVRDGYLPWRRRTPTLDALARAGGWLRAFGRITVPHGRERLATSEDFGTAMLELGTYLDRELKLRGRTSGVFERAAGLASRVLPARLELALAHGDVAPRNILRRTDGSVLLIDTLGRWRTSPMEDLAYARLALTASPTALLVGPSALLAWPRRCADALVRGYFGADPVPWSQLALYEVLVLADRWASDVDRRAGKRRPPWLDRALDVGYRRRAVEALDAAKRHA